MPRSGVAAKRSLVEAKSTSKSSPKTETPKLNSDYKAIVNRSIGPLFGNYEQSNTHVRSCFRAFSSKMAQIVTGQRITGSFASRKRNKKTQAEGNVRTSRWHEVAHVYTLLPRRLTTRTAGTPSLGVLNPVAKSKVAPFAESNEIRVVSRELSRGARILQG